VSGGAVSVKLANTLPVLVAPKLPSTAANAIEGIANAKSAAVSLRFFMIFAP
jgi:hypothetical protein